MKKSYPLALCLLPVVLLLAANSIFLRAALAQGRGPAPNNLLAEADNFYRLHQYDHALQRYEHYLRTSAPPQQWHYAFLRTAELYGIRGDWQQARGRYEHLLTLKTDSGIAGKARYGAGQSHYRLGNFQEAERILENLSASTLPADLRFKTTALLTELALRSGNVPQAFSRLIFLEKNLSTGEEEWFQDLKTRLFNRATPFDLEKLADLHRDTPLTAAVLLQLGKLEIQAGRPEKAGTWLTTLQERFPDRLEAAQARNLLPEVEKTTPPAAPTVIGCLISWSGEYADVGRQVKNGLELAASQSGTALIMKDSGTTPEATAAAMGELANNPQVLAVVGFFPVAIAEAAADAAQRLELPLLALTQKKDITLSRTYVFRDFLTPRLMLQALLHHTANTRGWQRYAILYPNSKYGQAMFRQGNDEISRQSAKLAAQVSFAAGGRDPAAAVQTLVQATTGQEGLPAVEAIFIPDEAGTVAAMAKELAATPLAGVQLLGTNILQAPGTLQYADLLNGILFPDGFFAGDPDPAVKAFVADYRQRFEQSPTYMAAQGYSSLGLLAAAQKDFSGRSRREFADKLQHQTQPAGFSLFRGFNVEREAEVQVKILTIRDKKFELEN